MTRAQMTLTFEETADAPCAVGVLRRVTRPVAAWAEGAVAVPLYPSTLALARWIATLTPDVDVSATGGCMLVRMTETAWACWGERLYETVVDGWIDELRERGDGDALLTLSRAARRDAAVLPAV